MPRVHGTPAWWAHAHGEPASPQQTYSQRQQRCAHPVMVYDTVYVAHAGFVPASPCACWCMQARGVNHWKGDSCPAPTTYNYECQGRGMEGASGHAGTGGMPPTLGPCLRPPHPSGDIPGHMPLSHTPGAASRGTAQQTGASPLQGPHASLPSPSSLPHRCCPPQGRGNAAAHLSGIQPHQALNRAAAHGAGLANAHHGRTPTAHTLMSIFPMQQCHLLGLTQADDTLAIVLPCAALPPTAARHTCCGRR